MNETVMIGDEVTLPSLSDPEPGQLHVWCENADGTGNCYNGGDTIVVTDEGLTLYEAYIDDPAYVEPSVDPVPEPAIVPDGGDAANDATANEYTVSYYGQPAEGYGGTVVAYGTEAEQQDLFVPEVSERTDVYDEPLEKTAPLGVNMESNINSGSIWGILQQIWPYIVALLFSFFIFFILLFKRKKDDDEEEEAAGSKR